jgi:uncharacterized membrane protein YqhA
MTRFLLGTRYLILIPIIGLAIAASVFFVIGGFSLIKLRVELLLDALGVVHDTGIGQGVIIFEVVEYVHTFLVGTVLYITAVGLYQLFIRENPFPAWLKIDSMEELETNLIGVTVVVLAVNFMGAIVVGQTDNLLQYEAGIALPIAALGLFVDLRAWSSKITKEAGTSDEGWSAVSAGRPSSEEVSDPE